METGIKTIDEQHQKLVALINDFYGGIDAGSPKDRMLNMLTELKRYTEYHFEEEEAFMRAMNYPDFDAHIEKHKEFVERITEFENRFKSGKLLLTLEVTNFIKDWLVKHIMGRDMLYARFYKEGKE